VSKPYGEIMDEMDHEAKYLPATVGPLIPREVLADLVDTMRHARIFITTREKMHPTGVELWDDLYKKLLALR
jgi:hypothetical protein